MTARCLPVLFESLPYHNWEEVDLEPITAEDIDRDLAPLSESDCAARGIRHSSSDDQSSAVKTGDSFALRRRLFCRSVNRAFGRKTRKPC